MAILSDPTWRGKRNRISVTRSAASPRRRASSVGGSCGVPRSGAEAPDESGVMSPSGSSESAANARERKAGGSRARRWEGRPPSRRRVRAATEVRVRSTLNEESSVRVRWHCVIPAPNVPATNAVGGDGMVSFGLCNVFGAVSALERERRCRRLARRPLVNRSTREPSTSFHILPHMFVLESCGSFRELPKRSSLTRVSRFSLLNLNVPERCLSRSVHCVRRGGRVQPLLLILTSVAFPHP